MREVEGITVVEIKVDENGWICGAWDVMVASRHLAATTDGYEGR